MARVVGRGKVQAYRVNSKKKQPALKAAVQCAWVNSVLRSPAAKKAIGLPVDAPYPAHLRKSPYKIARKAGADPGSATLVVTLATAGIQLGAKIAWAVWKRFLEPYLDRKLKLKAMGAAPPKKKKSKAAKKTR